MSTRIRLSALVALVLLSAAGDALACGDKFLVGTRGTRYQRPKNARAASVIIYADPAAAGNGTALVDARSKSLLQREGHRTTTVTTVEQLSAILAAGSVDVVVVATGAAARIQQTLSGSGAAAVLAFDGPPKARALLSAIDSAVQQRDQTLKRN